MTPSLIQHSLKKPPNAPIKTYQYCFSVLAAVKRNEVDSMRRG